MKASIITIGSEILSGDILNKNAKNFSLELNEMGFEVDKHISIDDNFDIVVDTIREEAKKNKLILTTGGLGPTKDDLTKEAIGYAINREMILDEASADRLKTKLEGRVDAWDSNLDQAYFPKGAKVLVNDHGTADGFFIDIGGSIIVTLPGPPRENMAMFENYTKDLLKDYSNHRHEARYYRIYGIGEWETELMIRDLVEGPDELATFAKTEGLFIKVNLDESQYKDLNSRFKEYEEELEKRFGENLVDQGIRKPEELLGQYLMEKNISVSTAESITGGLIASKIISNPGISSCIKESYVTYSNDVKVRVLGVKEETIEEYGVVSEETVREMLLGLKKLSGSDLCIATSGYAGPGEGAGKVFYGAYYKDSFRIIERQYSGSRNDIRGRTANDAIVNAYMLIKCK